MKTNIFSFIVAVLLLSVIGCEKIDNQSQQEKIEEHPILLTAAERIISEKVTSFGQSSYISLLEGQDLSSKSFVYSPLSLAMALSLCQSGAQGETSQQIREVLRFQGVGSSELMEYGKKLADGLKAVDTTTIFCSSNAIFRDTPIVFTKDFTAKAENYFDADVRSLDMRTKETVDVINNWCCEKTDGQIESIVQYPWNPPFMMVANALVFKAKWPIGSQPDVKNDVFHSVNGSESCSFLNFKGLYNYFDKEHFKAISLPYGNGSYNLSIALPKEEKTIEYIIESIDDILKDLTSSEPSLPYNVDCSFPEFKIDESGLALKDMLINMGITDMFDDSRADFSIMSKNNKLYFTDVMQRAIIEVNKEGTDAAAVTAIVGTSGETGPIRFTINRPFFFMVYEKGSGTILFQGQKM